jgi:hypothetical protein
MRRALCRPPDFPPAYVYARSDSALHDKYLTPAAALDNESRDDAENVTMLHLKGFAGLQGGAATYQRMRMWLLSNPCINTSR